MISFTLEALQLLLDEQGQIIAAERAKLAGVHAALDAAGCPTGTERGVYDAVERIAGLHKTRDHAWRQADKMREALVAARAGREQAEVKTQQAYEDCGGFESQVRRYRAELTALKLKLEMAKVALEHYRKPETITLVQSKAGIVLEADCFTAQEALSQLNSDAVVKAGATRLRAAQASPTVTEIVYTWPDGREEVRYRRSHNSEQALQFINEVCDLIAKHGAACPYSYRHV